MYRDMYSHDLDDLRIREDDAATGVNKPRKGKDKRKEALEPNEATQLFECEDVPLAARRTWAGYLYLGCRDGEIKVLEWPGVDLKRRKARVHESIDRDAEEDGATKETKTGTEREIDIFPPLVPMLEAMHRESGGKGLVFPHAYGAPSRELRAHLLRAGVTRATLHKSSKTHRRVRAQDLRASCASWLGLAEQLSDDEQIARLGRRAGPKLAKDHLGHAELGTTEKHYERGRGWRITEVGAPFPALPEALLGAGDTEAPTGIPANNSCESGPSVPQVADITDEALRCRSRA